jgi:hypothetical protein
VEKIDENREIINATVDSGAVDNVVPEELGEQFEVKEARMSKKGGYYTAADGTNIYNQGERDIMGRTKEGAPAIMTFQVCAVDGPLGSVGEMCRAGSRVVFDDDGQGGGSYIENKETGKISKMVDDGKMCVIQLKVPKTPKGMRGSGFLGRG